MPALAIGLYVWLGEPDAVRFEAELAQRAGDVSDADIDTMVRQMTQQLQSRPPGQKADAPAWEMLARAHASRQRFADADKAYQRAIELSPDNANLLADRADLLSLLQGQAADGEPMRLVNRALQIDPGHPKALALAGSAAYGRKDFVAAQTLWQRARERAEPGSPFDQGLQSSLEAARAGVQASGSAALATVSSAAKGPTVAATTPAAGTAATTTAAGTATTATSAAKVSTANQASISGQVEIAPALRERLQPGDTLFIIARTPQGPRLPLAVLRLPATAGPTSFTLTDAQAMAPDHKLSSQTQVVVEARVSRSGNAMPQAGDLTGRTAEMGNTARGVRVVVDGVVN